MSSIEWTEATWNPVTGCNRVSAGCDNCYALTMAKRLKAMGSKRYLRDGNPKTSGPGFGVTVHPDVVNLPLRWRKPRRVFVNSMSDLFHDGIDDNWLADIFAVMATASWHTFQVLTKRHGRLGLLDRPAWVDQVKSRAAGKGFTGPWQWPLPNVWLGVSAETQRWADLRIPALIDTPAALRFVSAEPLLGPLDLSRWLGVAWSDMGMWLAEMFATVSGRGSLLDWVIVGGESGPGARRMDLGWADSLVDQCQAARTAVFVKQLGRVWASEHQADPKGGDLDLWPDRLRIREYPGGVTC